MSFSLKRRYFRLNRAEQEPLNVVLIEGETALSNASQIETYFDKSHPKYCTLKSEEVYIAEQIIQTISSTISGIAQAVRKRIVCLYRVSTVGQVEKDNIPMQKQYCQEFCKQRPIWKIIK